MKLEDVAKKIAMGPFGSNIKVSTFVNEGVPIISGAHLHGAKVVDGDNKFITAKHAQKLENSNVFRGDVIFTHAGNIGQVAYIPENSKYDRYVISQRQFYLRCDRSILLPEFITFYFHTPNGRHQLLANASQVGVPSIARPSSYLKSLNVPIPSIMEQKKIVSVIETLNDKIENNLQMNVTLQEMVSTIFKSWFVDFDPVHAKIANNTPTFMSAETAKLFPSSFADNGLPVGWNRVSADTICSITIGRTPPRKEQQWFSSSNDDIKWASIKDMGECGTYIFRTNEKLTVEATNKFNVCIVPKNTVILSFKLTVGRVAITDEAIATNEAIAHFNKLDSKYGFIQTEYLYTYLKGFNFDQLGSTSSIATAVNSKTIKAMPIMIAEPSCRDAFHKLVFPMFEQIRSNQKENQTLVELRDLLLPKLISGEICVKDAEREVEAAV